MERALEKTSTRRRENGQPLEHGAALFVVTDGRALSRPRLIFFFFHCGGAGCKKKKKSKRIDCQKREARGERSAEDTGGFAVFALTVEAELAIRFGPGRGFGVTCGGIVVHLPSHRMQLTEARTQDEDSRFKRASLSSYLTTKSIVCSNTSFLSTDRKLASDSAIPETVWSVLVSFS